MATNKKISELTEFTAAQMADDDLIVMVDVSDSTTKKVQASTFRATVSGVSTLSADSPLSVDAATGDVTMSLGTVAINKGGTGATDAATARTNLGLEIGTDVQAYDAGLADIAGLAVTDGNIIVGDGANWVAESGATARTSLGLGSIATQDSTSVNIDGGAIDGTTVGATTQSTGSFSSLTIGSATAVTDVDTDLTTVSASDDTLASAKAIKTYVDSQVGTVDTLSEILSNGNTTGANSIIVTAGQSVTTDTISETTAASGVTVDSLLIKDGGITAAGTSTFAGQTITDLGTVTTADINGGTITGITDLAVADGGTGASDAATARTNLGLGTISTQAATNVNIDGGAIDGTTIGGSSAAAGTFTTFTSTGIDDNATSTAVTIDSSQNVGIGTTDTSLFNSVATTAKLTVAGSSTNTTTTSNSDSAINIVQTNGTAGNTAGLHFSRQDTDGTPNYSGAAIVAQFPDTQVTGQYPKGLLAFNTSTIANAAPSEKMRIDSSGEVFIAKTTTALSTAGTVLWGGSAPGLIYQTRDGGALHVLNRLTSDGDLVYFQQDGTTEGSISVSGSTVSYNGGHLSRWSRLPDDSKDTSIVKGTVMTNLDEMVAWGDEENEQLNKMAVSSVEGDPNVAGVFVNWDDSDDWNDMNVAMTGDMVIRIAQGTTVARGDLLMSAGDGTAKSQGDDIVRSKTIAKVTSTTISHTYNDGSYLVPCVLMAC